MTWWFRSFRRLRGRPLLAALALAFVASCGLLSAIFPSSGAEAPRAFSHATHEAMDCILCHAGATGEVRAGMPDRERCMTCHEQLDTPDRPKEKTVAGFLDETGKPVWSAFTRQSDEIVFSHQAHADRKIDCAACHGPMVQDKGLVPAGMKMTMAACSACHAERAPAKNECRTCHRVLDRHVAPGNHLTQWGPTHGLVSRLGAAGGAAADCALCHRQDSCTTCHQTQAPSDHTNFWRLRAHGIASGLDRSRCQVCHRSDLCDRCHQQSAPLNHTGLFGSPRNRHCTGCHLPVQAAVGGCATCHQSTPSHALVPPWPAWHNASLACRSCHAATMRHPDNGQACTLCHR